MAEDEIREIESPLCFVIGPIGRQGTPERKHSDLLLNLVIKEVLEDSEFGYRVKRADEDSDPGLIGERIVQDILNASLVVADLTDLNPNAFYELGITHSAQKPAIHIARSGTALPFDNIQQRTIFVDLQDWDSVVLARRQLKETAKSIRSDDFRISNPVTNANAQMELLKSENPSDVALAQINQRVEYLEAVTRPHQEEYNVFFEHPARELNKLSSIKSALNLFLSTEPYLNSKKIMKNFESYGVDIKGVEVNGDLQNGSGRISVTTSGGTIFDVFVVDRVITHSEIRT